MLTAWLVCMGTFAQPDNRILLNGTDWTPLRFAAHAIENHRGGAQLGVVFIGDSHTQPGILTGVLRDRLQQHFGDGGRGFIAPLKLAGTHQPADYQLSSSVAVAAKSRLLNSKWAVPLGVGGVAVKFARPETRLTIADKRPGGQFDKITLFHAPGAWESATIPDMTIQGDSPNEWTIELFSFGTLSSVTVNVDCGTPFYGARLTKSGSGAVVDVIGNDGATYSHYARIEGFAEQVAAMEPSIIIIALGTNEAYGNIASVERNIDKLVGILRRANPDAQLILTTPLETHKKAGGGFVVNEKVREVRDIIMDYGRRHHVAVWDMYSVCGGEGASYQWLNKGYMNKRDHLHLLAPGYKHQGELLSKALIDLLTK